MDDAPLKLEIDIPDLRTVQAQLLGMHKKAPAVLRKSINATIRHVSSDIGKQAKKKYIVRQPEIKKTLHIKKASNQDLTGVVSSGADQKVRLYGFVVKPKEVITDPAAKPEAYMARLKKRIKAKKLTGSSDRSKAFIAQMASGHIGVFQRQKGRRTRGGKEPLAEMYGMSIPSMIRDKEVALEIQEEGQKFLHAQINKNIERVLGIK